MWCATTHPSGFRKGGTSPPPSVSETIRNAVAAQRFENPSNFARIQAEAVAYLNSASPPCVHEIAPLLSTSAVLDGPALATISSPTGPHGECWRWLALKTRGRIQEALRPHFPVLYELLEDPSIANASLSTLEPGRRIPPHRGYNKGYIRSRLPCDRRPVRVPPGPRGTHRRGSLHSMRGCSLRMANR